MLKDYNGEELSSIIGKNLWMVDFYATWCGPCQMVAPILEELSMEYNVLKVNVDNHKDLAIKYGVMSIPTIIIFKDGIKKNETIGFHTKEELLALIKESN